MDSNAKFFLVKLKCKEFLAFTSLKVRFLVDSRLVPRPLLPRPPKERPGTQCLCMHVVSPVFRGFVK